MKQTLSIVIMAVMLFSCSNNADNKALSDAKQVADGIKQMQPAGIATSAGGWTMTAKIDGKDWSANSLMPVKMAGRIVGENNGESISLPYQRRSMVPGDKTTFSHNNAVDIFTNDDIALWGGYTGEMEITKVDGDWVEGKFFVTGTSDAPDKKIEITNGFFRISLVDKK